MAQSTRSCPFCGMETPLNVSSCTACGKSLPKAKSVFMSYAHEDEDLRKQFTKHLSLMKRQGLITVWNDRDITVGSEWEEEIDENLDHADVILLLISPDFMISDYCYSNEMRRAMERHKRGEALVIPIILRHVDWHSALFGKLQAPLNGQPLTKARDRDEAWFMIVKEIKRALQAKSP